MANPNCVMKSMRNRKLNLVMVNSATNESQANTVKSEMVASGNYDVVRVYKYKTGAKPTQKNGYKQSYSYVVRGYKK